MTNIDSRDHRAITPATCSACGASVTGRFCTGCGTERRNGGLLEPTRWILGGGLVLVLMVLVYRLERRTPAADRLSAGLTPEASASAAEQPPDLSRLSPRQQFDRLYQRVINAAQNGDQSTVERFTPMALAAFGRLDSVDADARYHLAMLELHIGNLTGAKAQADSIHLTSPAHLFGPVIAAAVAKWSKDEAARRAADRDFLAHYDAEMASGKPEYQEHRPMLLEVKSAAAANR